MSKATLGLWKSVTVGDLVEKHFCGPSPNCEERQIFKSDEWGVLKTTAITWSGWDETAHKVLPKAYWNQPNIEVHSGDVLVTKAGPRHRVGVVCYVPTTRKQLVVSGKMIGLRPKSGIVDSAVLAGLIARQAPQKYIQDRTTGMAESQVNFANEVLLNTPLSLPPIDEQRVIAQISERLDTAIYETEAIIAKLKAVKQGLLHDLLTRGIDANGELRPLQTEAPHLYKDSPLGWIPKEWLPVQIGKFASLQRGHDIVETCFRPGPYPVVSSSGVIGHHAVKTSSGPNVVVGRKGSIGTVHYVASDFWAHDTSLYVTNFFGNDEKFVCHLFEHMRLARFGTKSGSPSLNRNDVHPLTVGRPSRDEQKRIAEALQSSAQRVADEEANLSKLKETKMGLMDDLLTGRVRVTPLLAGATE